MPDLFDKRPHVLFSIVLVQCVHIIHDFAIQHQEGNGILNPADYQLLEYPLRSQTVSARQALNVIPGSDDVSVLAEGTESRLQNAGVVGGFPSIVAPWDDLLQALCTGICHEGCLVAERRHNFWRHPDHLPSCMTQCLLLLCNLNGRDILVWKEPAGTWWRLRNASTASPILVITYSTAVLLHLPHPLHCWGRMKPLCFWGRSPTTQLLQQLGCFALGTRLRAGPYHVRVALYIRFQVL
mmetsp:Transcript_49869/g.116366  ORF Transcript_49869/g.116366 Transcript_49869/m.116366 type:complete len:239 (-) Transcript_49869:408-1124(-)